MNNISSSSSGSGSSSSSSSSSSSNNNNNNFVPPSFLRGFKNNNNNNNNIVTCKVHRSQQYHWIAGNVFCLMIKLIIICLHPVLPASKHVDSMCFKPATFSVYSLSCYSELAGIQRTFFTSKSENGNLQLITFLSTVYKFFYFHDICLII